MVSADDLDHKVQAEQPEDDDMNNNQQSDVNQLKTVSWFPKGSISDEGLACYINFLDNFTVTDEGISFGAQAKFEITESCQRKIIDDDGQMFKCGIKPILGERNKFSLNLIYEDINLANSNSKTEKELEVRFLNFPGYGELDTYPVSDGAISVSTSRNTTLFLVMMINDNNVKQISKIRSRDGFVELMLDCKILFLNENNQIDLFYLVQNKTQATVILGDGNHLLVVYQDEFGLSNALLFVGPGGADYHDQSKPLSKYVPNSIGDRAARGNFTNNFPQPQTRRNSGNQRFIDLNENHSFFAKWKKSSTSKQPKFKLSFRPDKQGLSFVPAKLPNSYKRNSYKNVCGEQQTKAMNKTRNKRNYEFISRFD